MKGNQIRNWPIVIAENGKIVHMSMHLDTKKVKEEELLFVIVHTTEMSHVIV